MNKLQSTIQALEKRKLRIADQRERLMRCKHVSVRLYTESSNEFETINKISEFFDYNNMKFVKGYTLLVLQNADLETDIEILKYKSLIT